MIRRVRYKTSIKNIQKISTPTQESVFFHLFRFLLLAFFRFHKIKQQVAVQCTDIDHLHQSHAVGGVEEVHSDELRGTAGAGSDLRDGQ